MSAVPYRSRLWTAADTNGTRFVTWEDFALNRDTNTPVNAQIELRANGDFITRSNGVETVYRRLDPEDWDGDGWRNEDDWDPCGWEEFYDMFCPELPEGADESAYYWIDIRPRWNSDICFYGDAPSNLEDPYVYGRAGETYRVRLLIGKTYDVESTQPLDIVAKSDDRIEVANVAPNSFTAVWPVGFTVAEGRAPTGRPRLGAIWNDGGRSFHVLPDPPWLHGEITWTNEFCCEVWGDGTNFTYACDNTCTCEGCTVYGNYWYEGYRLPVWGIHCGCRRVPDRGPAGVSISFDRSAVIYEDAYTNLPGEVVHPARSNVVLRCSAYGGTYGGTLSVTLNAAAQRKLSKVSGDTLPDNVRIGPDTSSSYEVVYSVLEPSDRVDDITATAIFHEDFLDETYADDASMTSVKVELEASYTAVDNPSENRHVFGVGEEAVLKCLPALSDLSASSSSGMLTDMRNGRARYVAPPEEDSPVITISCGGAQKEIRLDILEPEEYVVCSIATSFAQAPNEAGLIEMDFANRVFPTYVSFYAIEVTEIPMVSTNAIGYFAQPEHADDLDHGKRGAYGQWSRINEDNSTLDEVAMALCEKPWNGGGSYTWPIPNAWRVSGHNWATNIFIHTDQRFELDADGTARVSKFGWTGERGTNDAHRVYGGMSQ